MAGAGASGPASETKCIKMRIGKALRARTLNILQKNGAENRYKMLTVALLIMAEITMPSEAP